MKWISIITAVSFFLVVPVRFSLGEEPANPAATSTRFKAPPASTGVPNGGSGSTGDAGSTQGTGSEEVPNRYQREKYSDAAAAQTPQAYISGSQLGTQLSAPDVRLDNPDVRKAVNDAQLNQMLTEEEIRRKVKNKEITKKQGDQLRMANALAAAAGFDQTSQGGQPSGQKPRPSRRSSGTAQGNVSEAAQSDFGARTNDEVTAGVLRPRVGNPREPNTKEIVDIGAPSPRISDRASNVPPFLQRQDQGSIETGGRSSLDASEANVSKATEERSSGATQAAGQGIDRPAGAGNSGGPDSKLDELDQLTQIGSAVVSAAVLKAAKNRQLKKDRAPASLAAPSVDSSAPGIAAGLAGEQSSDHSAPPVTSLGMRDVLFGKREAESGLSSQPSESSAEVLVSQIDSLGDQLAGSKLTVWFLAFFILGAGLFVYARSFLILRKSKALSTGPQPKNNDHKKTG
jgi:hypothetical protein